MPIIYYIQVNLMCIILLLILFFSTKKLHTCHSDHLYRTMLVSTMGICAFDLIAELYMGQSFSGSLILIWGTNILYFLFSISLNIAWVLYSMLILNGKISDKVKSILLALAAALSLLVITTPWTGLLFTVDASHMYHRGPLLWIHWAFMIPCAVAPSIYASFSSASTQEKKAITYFAFLPCIALLFQLLIYGISISQVGTTGALFLLYIMLQSKKVNDVMLRTQILDELTNSDSLTTLRNRRAFDIRLEEIYNCDWIGVIYADMNGLKNENDTKGHKAGDRLICQFADYLREYFHEDEIYRIGGDEFVILCCEKERYDIQSKKMLHSMRYTASAGCREGCGFDVQEILKDAEKIMYQNKREHYISIGSAKALSDENTNRDSATDHLTGVKNYRAYIDFRNNLEKQILLRHHTPFAIAICNINYMKKVNEVGGFDAGNLYIINNCKAICQIFKRSPVFRIGGDEFLIYLAGADYTNRETLLKKALDLSILSPKLPKLSDRISFAIGMADYGNTEITYDEVFQLAYAKMSRCKESMHEQDHLKIEDIQFKAERDSLTGLYTRETFYHYAEIILKENPDNAYDLCISDIDRFRSINEKYGEKTGDRILKSIADFLKDAESEGILVARYGNDQFVSLIPHMDDDFSGKQLEDFYKNMVACNPIQGISINGKIGIYDNVEHDIPISVLCDRAMAALRTIKYQYGKLYAKYNDSIRKAQEIRFQIEQSMNEAYEQEQFQVYYQPKHAAKSGRLIGAEALIRWEHPLYGFMSPGDFIPLFEKNGFIPRVDYYVWQRTCFNIYRWKQMGIPVVPISVNTSRRDFEAKDYLEWIMKPIKDYQIDPSLLHIEVTESVFVDNLEMIIEYLNQCRKQGIKIEMDDFGAGYSSLNILAKLPLDILKLDIQFMRELYDDSKKTKVLSAIIFLAHALGLETIAEGVETEKQVKLLQELECDNMQGYYFSRPLSEEDFEKYLKEWA